MNKIAKMFATVGAGVVLALGTTTVAFASADGPQVCNYDPNTSCVKFYNDGDVIRVWDTNCDGHAAVAHVWAPEAGIYNNFFYTGGCGTYGDYAYGTSMPEDVAVYYQACSSISATQHTYEHCGGIGGGRS